MTFELLGAAKSNGIKLYGLRVAHVGGGIYQNNAMVYGISCISLLAITVDETNMSRLHNYIPLRPYLP